MSILEEISQWQIEARNEDPNRYFFHRSGFEKITSGDFSYIIGRKGSGKTAIAERLSLRRFDSFSRKLSFRNFPFGLLYAKSDTSFSRPHQYISIWRYVIYRYICSMLVQNQGLAGKIPNNIAKAMRIDVSDALDLTIDRITGGELNLEFMGIGGSKSHSRELAQMPIATANETLAEFIWSVVDDHEYFVLFDELDEDYASVLDSDRREEYFALVVGLFKAVDLVSSEAKRHGRKIMPIIFLRDDIFELCPSQDRNKWLDRAMYLKWTPQQLENLLNFRLFRAAFANEDASNLTNGWNLAFSVDETRFGTKRRKTKRTSRYLLDHTFDRPRDIVHIVREAARQSIDLGHDRIGNDAIKAADAEHSRYMKREVQAELIPILEENEYFFEALSVLGKPFFRYNEFKERLAMTFNTHGFKCPLTNAQIARLLYRFNVIGNFNKSGRRYFLYNSNSRSVDLEGQLCIHRGLLKALDLI